jgi:hypothetical protein
MGRSEQKPMILHLPRVACALLAISSLIGVAPACLSQAATSPDDQVASILVARHANAAEEILGLGVSALPALVNTLLKGDAPDYAENRPTILQALKAHLLADVHDAFLAQVEVDATISRQLIALQCLGVLGDTTTLPVLSKVLKSCPEPLRDAPPTSTTFHTAVHELFLKDPLRFPQAVQRSILDTPTGLRKGVISILATRPTLETVSQIMGIVERCRDPDIAVAALLMVPAAFHPLDLEDWDPILEACDHSQQQSCSLVWPFAAKLALLSPEGFITALDDTDLCKQRAALEALRILSGQRFAASSSRWQQWWDEEQQAWDSKVDSILSGLQSDVAAERLRSLQGLVAHPFLGREVVPEVAALIHDEDVNVCRVAIDFLRRLGGARWTADIAEHLGNSDPNLDAVARLAVSEFLYPLAFPDRAAFDAVLEKLRR